MICHSNTGSKLGEHPLQVLSIMCIHRIDNADSALMNDYIKLHSDHIRRRSFSDTTVVKLRKNEYKLQSGFTAKNVGEKLDFSIFSQQHYP